MKNATLTLLIVIAVTAAFLAGSWRSDRVTVALAHSGASATAERTEGIHDSAPGIVKLTHDKQQLLGIQVSPVQKAEVTSSLRLLGRVAADETRMYRLNAGVDGYIRDVSGVTTGSQVKKDQRLASFSAPTALAVIQTYILNLDGVDRVKRSIAAGSVEAQASGAANSNIQQRLTQLRNLGMSVLQADEIAHTREIPESIYILSPVDGFVLARNVSPGQKFDRGAEWYRIADLRRVWVVADVFENDARYIRPGMSAQVTLRTQGKTLVARISDVLPEFDAATRTLKVRLEVDNPGYVLRPDMFVDIELPISLPPTIAVPADALLDSGLKRAVFVDRGEGAFEAREVETGWRLGDRVEIVKGLSPGERIVTSSTFLLESEQRMKWGAEAGGHGGHQHAGHVHAASAREATAAVSAQPAHDHGVAHDHGAAHDHTGH
jgi:membrane fusion protein, copper/silver efflux system